MAENRGTPESVGEKCHHNPELTAVPGKFVSPTMTLEENP